MANLQMGLSGPSRYFCEPTPVATSVVDADGGFLWADPATCELLGIAAERLLLSFLGDFAEPDEVEAELLAMHRLSERSASYEVVQSWRGPTGGRRHVVVRGSLIGPGPSGYVDSFRGFYLRQVFEIAGSAQYEDTGWSDWSWPLLADGTIELVDRPRAGTQSGNGHCRVGDSAPPDEKVREALVDLERRAEQLERSNRDLSEFAHIAAHDLRAPLAALAGSAELLVRRSSATLSEEAQRYLANILDRVGAMRRMIDDLLAYSGVGSGEVLETVDCNEVVADVLMCLASEIAEAEADITVEPLAFVDGNRIQLFQLFQNLVSNALKFRRPRGRAHVLISVRYQGGEQVYSVADAGIGVAASDRDAIFQMFHRLNPETGSTGTGIGLAICKRIVERHGGRIWVDNSRQGGLRVCFTLGGRVANSRTQYVADVTDRVDHSGAMRFQLAP